MDPKINLPSPKPKSLPKGKSVIDEINRGKEYSKLLEQRQTAVPINSVTAALHSHKTKSKEVVVTATPDPVKQIAVPTIPAPVTQNDKTKSGQALVTATANPVGQIAVPTNLAPATQNDKTKSGQALVTATANPVGQIAVPTNLAPATQNDKTKSGQALVTATANPVGQIAVPTNLAPATQNNKTRPGQVDLNLKTTSKGGTEKVETKPIELCQQLYPDVYVERIIVPEYQPNYDDIPRASRNIINRDTLTLKQHMNLLAQPKVVKERQIEPPYVVRRKVPGPSPRIHQLARPKKRQIMETCNRYGATMEKFCIENCHRNVQDVTFVPVQDAVYFIELNRRRPLIEKEKLELRMKRLQEKIKEAKMAKTQDVLRTLYTSLKGYLQPPPPKRTKKPAECAECVKSPNPCDKCTKIQAKVDDDADDSDADDQQDVDDDTEKLSSVLRGKMEKLLNHTDKIKEGSHWDLLLARLSNKLATWVKKLQNSEMIEEKAKVIADVVAADADVSTDAAANVNATVTN